MYFSILIKRKCVTQAIYQSFSSEIFERHLAARFCGDQITYICNIFAYLKDIALSLHVMRQHKYI